MRETSFIKQNKEKWEEFEKNIHLKNKDPEKLSGLFIQLTDDLAYARTHYRNRSVRFYLNGLAQSVFTTIYKTRKFRLKQFVGFWKDELPAIVVNARKELLTALIVFLIAMGIGVISSHNDPEFPKIILGNGYVEMTKANIKSGDPMAVYKSGKEVDSFFQIAINNIRVAFTTFLLGILAGIGSIGFLGYNGIMVGAFQYFFFQKGIYMQSILAIWLHGTLEISSIVIAGGAGITLGRGLIFPGTYSRLEAFQVSGRRGLKLLLGTVPIFILAALIEGFLTRYTNAPAIIRGGIILSSLVFILGYFVWYPWKKWKAGLILPVQEVRLRPTVQRQINFSGIKTNGEMFSDLFYFYRKKFRKIILLALVLAALYTVPATVALSRSLPEFLNYQEWFFIKHLFSYSNAYKINFLGGISCYLWLLILNTFNFAVLSFVVFRMLGKENATATPDKTTFLTVFKTGYKLVIISFVVQSLLILPSGWGTFLLSLVLPVLLLWMVVLVYEKQLLFLAVGRSFSLFNARFSKAFGLYLMLLLVSVIYFNVTNSGLTTLYFEFITWNLKINDVDFRWMHIGYSVFVNVFFLNLLLPVLLAGMGFLYYSLKEIMEANYLKERIDNLAD